MPALELQAPAPPTMPVAATVLARLPAVAVDVWQEGLGHIPTCRVLPPTRTRTRPRLSAATVMSWGPGGPMATSFHDTPCSATCLVCVQGHVTNAGVNHDFCRGRESPWGGSPLIILIPSIDPCFFILCLSIVFWVGAIQYQRVLTTCNTRWVFYTASRTPQARHSSDG